MEILGGYRRILIGLLPKWNLNIQVVRDTITVLLFFPITICFLLFIISLVAEFVAGRMQLGIFLIELPFLLLFLIALIFFNHRKYNYVRYFLVIIFYSVSVFGLYYWGVLHYLGIAFGVLLMLLSFLAFSIRKSLLIIGSYFLILIGIGILQSNHLAVDNYRWLPQLYFIDYLIVLVCLFIIANLLWLYNLTSANQIRKISALFSQLREKNRELEKRALSQTILLMKNRLKLAKSQEILGKAYGKLTLAEKDCFSHMNRLAHTAISVGKRVHNIKSPLMYVMNEIRGSQIDFDSKNALLNSLSEISAEVESIGRDTSSTNYSVTFNISDVIEQALHLLEWKFHEKGVVIPKLVRQHSLLFGDACKFKHVIVNLLDNALEAVSGYSDPYVAVRIVIDHDLIKIEVVDNGAGVEDGHVRKLFKSFFSTRENGCGLGLSISQVYVNNYWNGNITYSRVNGESIFTVAVPKSSTRN